LSASFRLGLAVWGYRGWLGGFLPEGSRQADFLKRYGERLAAVECNSVFYAIPNEKALARWVEETPAEFRFCPKLPRFITHEGPMAPMIPEALDYAVYMREHLGEKLGPFFLQLPPTFRPDHGRDLAALLNAWRRADAGPMAVEVRAPAWFREPAASRLDTLLSRLGMSRVVLDVRTAYEGPDDPQETNPIRKPNLPLYPATTGDFAFVRYISHPDGERNDRYLTEWAERVHGWLDAGINTWFFVHCPIEDHSPDNLRRFHQLLVARGAPVPPLPWDGIDERPVQIGLF